jgi:hypothetical protein
VTASELNDSPLLEVVQGHRDTGASHAKHRFVQFVQRTKRWWVKSIADRPKRGAAREIEDTLNSQVTVFILEDDFLVRNVIANYLRSGVVVEAETGEEAIASLAVEDPPIDVLSPISISAEA